MNTDINLILKKFTNFYTEFNDTKEDARYLINFKTSNNELKFYVTNGENQWFLNINDKTFSTIQQNKTQIKHQSPAKSNNFIEFLENMYNILTKKQFSLQKLYNTETSNEIIKFETINISLKQINFFLKLNENYKSIEFLKETCFSLIDKNNQLEEELKNTQNTQTTFKMCENDLKTDFKQNMSIPSVQQRKPGMSIINPHSRKRRVPKGVQFGDDDDDKSEESD
jgi:hypothetical protein